MQPTVLKFGHVVVGDKFYRVYDYGPDRPLGIAVEHRSSTCSTRRRSSGVDPNGRVGRAVTAAYRKEANHD